MAYTSQTTKLRCQQAQKDYRAGHLEQTQYLKQDPIRNPCDSWLRTREKAIEKGINNKYGLKDEHARISMEINSTKNTFEPLDTKSLYFMKRRDDSQEKWLTSKPFVTMSGPKDKPWEITPILEQTAPHEPYKERVVTITSQRNTLKEIGTNEWDAYSHKDNIWSKRMIASDSMRTYFSIKGQIQSLNGQLSQESVNSARDTINSIQSLRKHRSQQSLQLPQNLSVQHPSLQISSPTYQAPAPTSFTIHKGDMQKVEQYMTLKKEFPQKSALLFLPGQQLPQTVNKRFKGPVNITDQYLEDRILQSKQKMYYKSAEVEVLTKQNTSAQNNTILIDKSQSSSMIQSGVPEIDIGKLILNEKMSKPTSSSDHSPLVSAKRQLSNINQDDQETKDLVKQQSFDSKREDLQKSPMAQRYQSQLQKAEKIQEESDETDEDSPWKKKLSVGKSPRDMMILLEAQATPQSMGRTSSLKSSLKKPSNSDLELRKKEFYQLNPTLQKVQRGTQLKQMMNVFFVDEGHKSQMILRKKDSLNV